MLLTHHPRERGAAVSGDGVRLSAPDCGVKPATFWTQGTDPKTHALCEARTHDLQIMILTHCLLHQDLLLWQKVMNYVTNVYLSCLVVTE